MILRAEQKKILWGQRRVSYGNIWMLVVGLFSGRGQPWWSGGLAPWSC